MLLQLDPHLPVVWRDPTTVQLGVDVVAAVLTEVDAADERLLSVLARGVAGGAPALAVLARAPVDQVARRLLALEGALSTASPPPTTRVAVVGDGGTATVLAELARDSGLSVRRDRHDDDDTDVDLAVLVADHVLAPRYVRRWLRDDVPHLLVRRGDAGVDVGPFVRPGSTACSRCLDLERTDVDPSWPAVAAQLWRRSAPQLPHLAAAVAASLAVKRVRAAAGLGGRVADEASVLRVDLGTAEVTVRETRPHPACGCAAPPGTGSGDAPRPAPGPIGSTRSASAVVPA